MGQIEYPLLTKSELLDASRAEAGAAGQVLQAAAYSALGGPLRALAQTADHIGGGQNNSIENSVKDGLSAICIKEPQAEAAGTKSWYMQHLGSAAGMMLPFLALRGGIAAVSQKAFGNLLEARASDGLMRIAAKEAVLSGSAGFAYGSLLTASREDHVGKYEFVGDRLKRGLVDAASFAAISAGGVYMAKGLDKSAALLQASSFQSGLTRPAAAMLREPALAGLVSGLPAAVVNAEANALSNGNLLPDPDEFKESLTGMSFVGLFMGGASRFLAPRHVMTEKRISGSAMETRSNPAEFLPEISVRAAAKAPGRILSFAELEALASKQSVAAKHVDPAQIRESVLPARAAAESSELTLRAISDRAAAGTAKQGIDIVLGASGVQAPAHAGFLRAIEERSLPVAKVTGVSGGSIVAALYTNKYSPAEIQAILLSNEFRHPRAEILARCFHLSDPWNLAPYSIDFRPWIQDLVDTYKLKPQENLRIVAADRKTNAPVVFEGRNYDIVDALTASTAVTPGIMNMKPVKYQGRELIDGFYYHPTPADLAKAPALVSKIGFVNKLPTEVLSPWDYFLHLREMNYYEKFSKKYPDPKGHLIAQTGLDNVASTTFGISPETLLKMVDHGYKATNERLSQPDAIKAIKDAQQERNLR